MKWLGIGGLGVLAGSVACGNGATSRDDGEKTYPYVTEHGATVCSERTVTDDEGSAYVMKEFYYLDVMNEALAGRGVLEPGAIAAMREAGLDNVATCEDARRYTEIDRTYVESRPFDPSASNASLPAAPSEALPPAETPDGETIDKIADGQNNSNHAIVRIQHFDQATGKWAPGCSGVLIGWRALLTAAHCFGATGQFRDYVRVDHGRGTGGPDASIQCISGTDSCVRLGPPLLRTPNVTVHIDPNFNGSNIAFDLALVVSDVDWRASLSTDPPVTTSSMMRITASAPGAGETYWLNGYGAHAGTGSGLGIHRQATRAQGYDDSFATYLRDKVQSGVGRPCAGDSGSPAINTTRISGLNLAIALHINSDRTTYCPEPGAFFRHTRINDKIGFIENRIACTAHSSGGWSYRKCF